MFCSASTYYVVPVILAVWAPLAPGSRMFLSCLFFTISLVTSELPFYHFSIFFDISSGKAQTFFSVIYHVKALFFVDFASFLQIFPQNTHYKTRPELKNMLFTYNNNYLLCYLLIKIDIYKKAIYLLWPILLIIKLHLKNIILLLL